MTGGCLLVAFGPEGVKGNDDCLITILIVLDMYVLRTIARIIAKVERLELLHAMSHKKFTIGNWEGRAHYKST